jgi:hypothetical protein
MTDPNQPYFPQYPPQGPPPPPPRGPGLAERLGDRGRQRPGPRLGTALAGAGIGLAVLGVVIWSLTYLVQGIFASIDQNGGVTSTGDSRRWLGVGLSFAVVAIGYVLAIRFKQGPLATGGVAATALGIPILMGFLSFSLSSGSPVSIDAVVLVSIAAYLISYFLVPGARGHTFYLGLAAVNLWAYLLDKVEPHAFTGIVVRPVTGALGPFASSSQEPDLASIAGLSLVFGIGYYAVAGVLDRRGHSAPGVAFVLAGFVATLVGIAAAANDLKQIGTGVLLIVLGLVIAALAARAGRRFTTWVWSGAVALGVALIIGKLVGNDHTALGGALFIVAGFALVGAAYALSNALHEPDEFAAVAAPVPSGH